MWKNFSFPCMTIVGKLKISPHVEKFQMSPHDRCGEIWNSPHMACVWCRKRRHICKIYAIFMWRKIEPKSTFVEKKWQIWGLLTHSLTHSRLVNLIDVTLPCEDAYSKLVEVVTVADVSDEDRVGNSLLQIWNLRFGHIAKLWFRLWAQGLVKILKMKLRRDFEVEVWSVFCCWCLVEVTEFNLGQDFKARFGQDFKFKFSWDAVVWLRFWSECLIEIL